MTATAELQRQRFGTRQTLNVLHDAGEAVALIADDTDLVVSGFNGEPVEILDAIEQAVAEHRRHRLTVHEMFATTTRRSMRGEFAHELAHTSYFLSDTDRGWLARGVDYVPANLSEVPALIARRAKRQPLVLATIAAHNGRLYWGTNGEYTAALVRDGAPTIVEINAQMPYLPQCPFPQDQVLAALYTDRPMLELPAPRISPTDERIAELVAERIASGATLQIGIGGVPDRVCEALKADRRDLRVHTEMLSDGLASLIQSGATSVSPAMPALAAFAMGTAALYAFMDGNPAVRVGPADEINDPARIAALPNMTAVCATTEVDLYGQCVSGTIAGRWYSGSGGQLDFMRGVHACPDGQGFTVLRSTLKDGSSRIKLSLSPLSAVTIGIDLVDKIVTEHGVAELKGRSLSERARALIAIAAPEHREKLRFQAHQAKLL